MSFFADWMKKLATGRQEISLETQSGVQSDLPLDRLDAAVNIFAIFKTASGELVSVESDDALQRNTDTQLAALGLSRVGIAQFPDLTHVWNPATRTLQIQAFVDIIATLKAKPSNTWALTDI